MASTIRFGEVIDALGDTPSEAIADLAISLEIAAARSVQQRGGAGPFSGPLDGGIPADLSDWLEREAERQGVSATTLIVSALAEARGRTLVGTRTGALERRTDPHTNDVGGSLDSDIDV